MPLYCYKCGTKLPDNAKFYIKCGSPVKRAVESSYDDVNARVANAARRLQQGDGAAFSELFEGTRSYVAACIHAQNIPNEYLDDVMQEVYLSVYQSIRSLNDPNKVLGWIKVIAFNKSHDFHRKRGGKMTEVLEDEVTDEQVQSAPASDAAIDAAMQLPESITESKGMQAVLRGFIDELPSEQSSLFYAHYLNGLSAVEIARAAGINESTVRSRLMRSREKLQQRVNAYSEQTGVRMRPCAIAPLLWIMLRDSTTELLSASKLTAQQVLDNVRGAVSGTQTSTTQANTPADSGAAQQGAASAGKKVGWFAAHKVALISAAVTVVVAGAVAFGGYAIVSNTSGGDSGQQAASASSSQESNTPDPAEIAAAYNKVLDNVQAGRYSFKNPDEPDITPMKKHMKTDSTYALRDINGDSVEELLVECPALKPENAAYQYNMLVFTYKAQEGAVKLDGVISFEQGTASRVECRLYVKKDNQGVYKRSFDSIYSTGSMEATGSMEIVSNPDDPYENNTLDFTKITVNGDALVEKDLGDSAPDDVGSMIKFTDINNRSKIKKLAGSSAEATQQKSTSSESTQQQSPS